MQKNEKAEFICQKNCRICPSPGAICNRNDNRSIKEDDSSRIADLLKEKSNRSKEGNA